MKKKKQDSDEKMGPTARCLKCGLVPLSECPTEVQEVEGEQLRVAATHSCGSALLYLILMDV